MKKLFLFILLIAITSSCSNVRTGDIFKKPNEQKQKFTGKLTQNNIVNANIEKTFDALIDAAKWSKWDVAFSDKEDGTIILKEAYVYRKGGKLLRIYHWPSGSELASSRIPEYISKISNSKDNTINNSISFTQESMKINLNEISGGKTKVEFEYSIIPFTLSTSISSELNSSGYIENLILKKASESL